MADADTPWAHDVYLIRRKVFKIFGGAFHVYGPTGGLIFYGEQKAFKLKEDMRVYADETKRMEILRINARGIIDFGMTYDVHDSIQNQPVGALRRKGLKSMVRDEWHLLAPGDQQIGACLEDSLALALVRRFLTNLVPQSYHIESNGQHAAVFKQHFNPFVFKMTLDFSADGQRALDRRLGLALAVCLLIIEGRQQ